MEVTTGWLEPLLSTIAEDSNVVVYPIIDTINNNTLDWYFILIK